MRPQHEEFIWAADHCPATPAQLAYAVIRMRCTLAQAVAMSKSGVLEDDLNEV